MNEDIRLIIWDLDDTFWTGTLSEGGYSYDHTIHDLVITMAQRGIMSSICSKNNFTEVQDILTQKGIWQYFIFPSINWEAKGPRIKALIETVQLRPSTILFIDDNHLNREEAKFYAPGLVVYDETIILELLDHPRLQGKNDVDLVRLHQYKLLECRKVDENAAGGSNADFLRSSDIRVTIDHDIERSIDRAVELINRTNQLNFTKVRLSEEISTARSQLRELLRSHAVQAGLVKVSDRYGDYGYTGFYATYTDATGRRLLHFCFSCRILNMGVEQWLYRRLGCPSVQVVGEVLSDIFATIPDIDWITNTANHIGGTTTDIEAVFARGGCDLSAITHYFEASARAVTTEFVITRDSIDLRFDHSLLLRYAIESLEDEQKHVLEKIGYRPSDFETLLFADSGHATIRLFSCWGDAHFPVYRHRQTGVIVPFNLAGVPWGWNLTKVAEDEVRNALTNAASTSAFQYLREHFEVIEPYYLPEAEVKHNIRLLLQKLPKNGTIFILLPNSLPPDGAGDDDALRRQQRLSEWIASAVEERADVIAVDVSDFISTTAELHDVAHFDRAVYYRLFEHIKRLALATAKPHIKQ